MGFPILVRRSLYIESVPWSPSMIISKVHWNLQDLIGSCCGRNMANCIHCVYHMFIVGAITTCTSDVTGYEISLLVVAGILYVCFLDYFTHPLHSPNGKQHNRGETVANDIGNTQQKALQLTLNPMQLWLYPIAVFRPANHRRGNTVLGIILCMRPANERRRYIVTSSLIGWVHTQNDPCIL